MWTLPNQLVGDENFWAGENAGVGEDRKFSSLWYRIPFEPVLMPRGSAQCVGGFVDVSMERGTFLVIAVAFDS